MALYISRASTFVPSPTDQLAPGAPTGATGVNGVGSVTFTCDQTVDINDGVTAGSGVAQYVWNIGGVDQSPVTAPNANILALPTAFQVGSYSPAATSTQLGRAFTLNSAGTGNDSTSDQLLVRGWEVTGDFDLYCLVSSFTGPGYAYAPTGLMWREATAATVAAATGARMGCIYQWLQAAQMGIQAKDRTATNGATTPRPDFNPGAQGDSTPRYLHIRKRRSGTDDLFTYRWSAGGPWTVLYTVTYSGLSNTLFIGGFVCDLQASPQVLSSVLSDLRYTAGGQSAITSPAFVTSTTVSGKVKAIDALGNVGPYSPAVLATGTTVGITKFNPGFGVVPDFGSLVVDPTRIAKDLAFLNTISADASIVNVLFKVRWASLEGNIAGDCTAGFAWVDQMLAACAACTVPKKMFITVVIQTFQGPGGSSETNPTAWYPQYAISAGIIQTDSGKLPNTCVQVWKQTAADILNTFEGRYGARYDADARFGGWALEGETANDTMPDDQRANFHLNTKRRMAGTRAVFATSELRLYLNFYRASDCPDILLHAAQYRYSPSGPDPELPINTDGTGNEAAGNWRPIDGWRIFIGKTNIGDFHTYPPGPPGIDQRGILPCMPEIESLGYGGIDGFNEPADDIIALFRNTYRATHIFMSTSDDPSYLPTQRWTTYVLPLIRSIGPFTRPRPSCYT